MIPATVRPVASLEKGQASYHHCWFSADADSSVTATWYSCALYSYRLKRVSALEGFKGDRENQPAL